MPWICPCKHELIGDPSVDLIYSCIVSDCNCESCHHCQYKFNGQKIKLCTCEKCMKDKIMKTKKLISEKKTLISEKKFVKEYSEIPWDDRELASAASDVKGRVGEKALAFLKAREEFFAVLEEIGYELG